MKKDVKLFLFLLLTLICFFSCEPLSVSVNKEGEIAFTRREGIFYFNYRTGKLTSVLWNYGKEAVPVIARWDPPGELLAVTLKDSKDSQNTSILIINKKGEITKVYSSANIITQLEWSPDMKYISFAQSGKNTETGVADLGFVSIKDGLSKIFIDDAGDVHKWMDNGNIVFVKINKKNPDNTDIFSGELSAYSIEKQAIERYVKVMVSKTGSLDYSASRAEVAITAITLGDKEEYFTKDMKSNTYLYLYSLKNKKNIKPFETFVNFAAYSPDSEKLLIKTKKEASDIYDLNYFRISTKENVGLIKNTVDTVSAGSVSVQAYPAWLNNNIVLYWRISKNYGSNGESLNLMEINLSTMKKQNFQPFIDLEINKLIEEKGGY